MNFAVKENHSAANQGQKINTDFAKIKKIGKAFPILLAATYLRQ